MLKEQFKLLSFYIFLGSSLLLSQDVTLSFGLVDEDAGTMEILMDSNSDVYGFQFNVSGIEIDAVNIEPGDMVPGDWMLSGSETMVLGFSLMATFIPAGSGTLVTFPFTVVGGDMCINILKNRFFKKKDNSK